jgi:hypothetical protein
MTQEIEKQQTPGIPDQMAEALERARQTQGTILSDLEAALNMIRQYQRYLDMLVANDPQLVASRRLLTKYGMATGHNKPQPFRIYDEGRDITEHPDSIEGSVDAVQELPSVPERETPALPPGDARLEEPGGDETT